MNIVSKASAKDIETIMRFVLIVEFWLEEGNQEKASETLNQLKKMVQSQLH